MSTFERDNYRWRETYFVLFDSAQRPTPEALRQELESLSDHFELTDMRLDDEGGFESLTLVAPEAYSALDICYLTGEEVLEQGSELFEELQAQALPPDQKARLARLPVSDARFDVLHFEEVVADGEDEPGGMLDPSALLMVLSHLARVTSGMAIDPQSGTVM